ncbi:hypothetical protein [Caballeronia sp. EK]|uniref:hypothetical protein n=1 Tax=Caballeronia sp. EK TaxID=2767469 RepID=UPI003F8D45D4
MSRQVFGTEAITRAIIAEQQLIAHTFVELGLKKRRRAEGRAARSRLTSRAIAGAAGRTL